MAAGEIMKEATVEMSGTVVGVNRNSATVDLANGSVIRGVISGKMMQHHIRAFAGDKVKVEMSPYDLTKGRITYRFK
jgi:translation initiation factor IF-1